MDETDGSTRYYQELLAACGRYAAEFEQEYDDLDEFIASGAMMSKALLYAGVFCPPLIEIEGMIFQWLDWQGPRDTAKTLVNEMLTKERSRQEVQRSLNLIVLSSLLVSDEHGVLAKDERLFVNIVAQAWRGWLHVHYPTRRFVVTVLPQEETQDVGPGVTFHELA